MKPERRLRAKRSSDQSRWSIFAPRLLAVTSTSDALRIERVIALARLLLTVIALVQVSAATVQPAAYAPLARWLLIFFAAHSVSAVLVLHTRRSSTTTFALTTHAVDLVAAAITLPMAAPSNSFFTFFLFVLAAAAFRWGFRETLATTVAAITLVLLHGRLATALPALSLGVTDTADLGVRAAYLAMMGLLLAYLAEESRALRAEAAAIARLLGKVSGDADVSRTLTEVGSELVSIFDASRVVLVVEDLKSHRLFRWDTSGGWRVAPAPSAGRPPSSDRLTYLFAPEGQSLAVWRRRSIWTGRWACRTTALDESGRVIDAPAVAVTTAFADTYPFLRLAAVPVSFGDEWAGQLFILDPQVDARLLALTRFLQSLVRQVSPALVGVYLQHQLRVRAGAVERARVARELHDGVIQSLVGVEMQMQVLRGLPTAQVPAVAREIEHLQRVVHDEVLNLRDLMQHMRPPDLDPKDLVEHLARLVDGFGRDNGIAARFSSGLGEVVLPRDICFELVRIVQEGLVNIRKHSAATSVLVRLGLDAGHWKLEMDDNGVGFPFSGRLSLAELEAARLGPIVIKERVRAIGGQLSIESTPGRGTRLMVLVPQVPFA